MTLTIKRRYSIRYFKRSAHPVWECTYHLVRCPKYRFRILDEEVGASVRKSIRQLCKWKKVEILENNIQMDHIHLVMSFPPKYSISELVGCLKGKSAIKMFDKHTVFKKRYWGRHFWAKWYCVSTVGLNEEQIKKYVRWRLKRAQIIDQLKLCKR